MPQERGRLPPGADAYEENNRWMLEAACRFGAQKVEFVCLWDGADGDGPGGTQHLMEQVRRRAGRLHWIDSRALCEATATPPAHHDDPFGRRPAGYGFR